MSRDAKTYYACVVKFHNSNNYVAFMPDTPQVIGIGITVDDAMKSLSVSLKGALRAKDILTKRKAAKIQDEPFIFNFQNHQVESLIRAVTV